MRSPSVNRVLASLGLSPARNAGQITFSSWSILFSVTAGRFQAADNVDIDGLSECLRRREACGPVDSIVMEIDDSADVLLVLWRPGACFHHQQILARQKGVRTLFCSVGGGYCVFMGRPSRADEAGGIYHALNRDNARAEVFSQTGGLRFLRTDPRRGTAAIRLPDGGLPTHVQPPAFCAAADRRRRNERFPAMGFAGLLACGARA